MIFPTLPALPFALPLIPEIIVLGTFAITLCLTFTPRLCQTKLIRYLAKLLTCLASFWLFHYYLQLGLFD
jgi:hypothetical protein